MAHTAGASLRLGVSEDKLAAIWEYRTSPLYSEAERTALDFAIAAASQPNAVTDDLFGRMKQHWTENQIVEIVGVIALFGWLNRFNDTMATPLARISCRSRTALAISVGLRPDSTSSRRITRGRPASARAGQAHRPRAGGRSPPQPTPY